MKYTCEICKAKVNQLLWSRESNRWICSLCDRAEERERKEPRTLREVLGKRVDFHSDKMR